MTNDISMSNVENRSDQNPFVGIAALMRKVSSGADISQIVNMAAYHPDNANMLMALSTIFQLTGNREMGMELQAKALQIRQLYHLPTVNGQAGIRLLTIMRPGDMMDNTPVDFLLEDSNVALDILYVSLDLPVPTSLPDHDVLFIAIGQSDQSEPLLKRLDPLIKYSPCAILNMPDRIIGLSRDGVSTRLKSSPDLAMPSSARIDRQGLQQICRGNKSISSLLEDGVFPIIVRPVDSHAGKGLVKIDCPEEITSYLRERPEEEFYAARFVDYHGVDGLFRKYRIALIDGKPFACHMAISDNWMIHYKNAGMSESVEKRAEEARFMANFDEDFALKHKAALKFISESLELEYLVIDCGETTEGKLLIFEADNVGFIHAMDPVDVFPYKQPQMRKVFDAFRDMLANAMNRNLLHK